MGHQTNGGLRVRLSRWLRRSSFRGQPAAPRDPRVVTPQMLADGFVCEAMAFNYDEPQWKTITDDDARAELAAFFDVNPNLLDISDAELHARVHGHPSNYRTPPHFYDPAFHGDYADDGYTPDQHPLVAGSSDDTD